VTDACRTEQIPAGWVFDRQSWHFHRRLWERYQVRLEYGEYSAIMAAVRHGTNSVLLSKSRRKDGMRKFAVKLRGGLWVKVLVDKRGTPVSALPWR
jgi:hypothetical protein